MTGTDPLVMALASIVRIAHVAEGRMIEQALRPFRLHLFPLTRDEIDQGSPCDLFCTDDHQCGQAA